MLTPTVLIFGIINPLSWLLVSLGLVGRSLKIALVIAPLVIIAYVVGLPFGPCGVAFAYSAVMTVWLLPHILWCLYGTAISPKDLFLVISRPLLSAVVAAAAALGAHFYFGEWSSPIPRLALAAIVMIIMYYFMLLVILRQYALYVTLFTGFRRSNNDMEKATVGQFVR